MSSFRPSIQCGHRSVVERRDGVGNFTQSQYPKHAGLGIIVSHGRPAFVGRYVHYPDTVVGGEGREFEIFPMATGFLVSADRVIVIVSTKNQGG